MSAVEERVAAGAAWLDEHERGWERRIDLASLELDDACRCVLGQLMPEQDFYATLGRIFNLPDPDAVEWDDEPILWAISHGFCQGRLCTFVSSKEYDQAWREYDQAWRELDEAWRELDEAWIALIKERFDAGTLSDGGS